MRTPVLSGPRMVLSGLHVVGFVLRKVFICIKGSAYLTHSCSFAIKRNEWVVR